MKKGIIRLSLVLATVLVLFAGCGKDPEDYQDNTGDHIPECGAAAEEVVLDDEDMLRMLTEGIRINGYRLSSTTFRMKGQHIPAFSGREEI